MENKSFKEQLINGFVPVYEVLITFPTWTTKETPDDIQAFIIVEKGSIDYVPDNNFIAEQLVDSGYLKIIAHKKPTL